jgi:NADH dehydrogenase [ubiquinone] 1 alpha subcomplex assembly factor 1
MQCSRRLLSQPGLFKRSADELKRLTLLGKLAAKPTLPLHCGIAKNVPAAARLETVDNPKRPLNFIEFNSAEATSSCLAMSDADVGGYSSSKLDFMSAEGDEPAHARFHGSISIDLPPRDNDTIGSGYAGFRTGDKRMTLLGRGFWDIDSYSFIALRLKSDGRRYVVNLQTDSLVPTDLHQHRLWAKRPGEWETILISTSDFVRTNHGNIAEPQSDLLRRQVKTIGLSLVDRVPGPFDLRVERMWATNGLQIERKALLQELRNRVQRKSLFDGDENDKPKPGQILM